MPETCCGGAWLGQGKIMVVPIFKGSVAIWTLVFISHEVTSS